MKKFFEKIVKFVKGIFTTVADNYGKLKPAIGIAVQITDALKHVSESDKTGLIKDYLKKAIPSTWDDVAIDALWAYLRSNGFNKLCAYVKFAAQIINTKDVNKRFILALAAVNNESADGAGYRALAAAITEFYSDGKIDFDELMSLCGSYYDEIIKPQK